LYFIISSLRKILSILNKIYSRNFMHVFVAGGAGYVGSRLVPEL
jgi:hypothetical protein